MRRYVNSDGGDMLLAQWWATLRTSGELEQLIGREFRTLYNFMRAFQPPTTLYYDYTDTGVITFAAWFEPLGDGAMMSVYVHPHSRKSRESLRRLDDAYDMAFLRWDVLLGVTRLERLIKSQQHLGYTLVGKIPHIFDRQDAWLLSLEKEAYYGRRNVREQKRANVRL